MRISLRPAEPGRSSFRLPSREWWTRSASGRPGFDQHADGLTDLDRAGPVTLAQVVQPCPDLWCHDQEIGHVSCLPQVLPIHDIT
jgi:hypothetical protein